MGKKQTNTQLKILNRYNNLKEISTFTKKKKFQLEFNCGEKSHYICLGSFLFQGFQKQVLCSIPFKVKAILQYI